ncbi:helix-turn-helix domain-containing protein [Pseudonocardia acaciae]|uniref:helix-turn-helix domain-containing protein n=1 Tax=Pseudonocardia acaciae TaxID=551276 RepID=UPI000561BE78|nr:helix-turn-helix transcriptional regulator [Pseudonocardia acaciae]
MTDAPHSHDDLPSILVALRTNAGLRQVDVASRAGIAQARISRAENGHALLTVDEVNSLARLYGADEADSAILLRMTRDAHAGYVDARVVLQTGTTANLQRRFAALERNATQVRAFQPMMVLGVLQTAGYAAVALETTVDDRLVRDRLNRQRHMLEDDRRHWVLVQTEGSLRWAVRSAGLMAEQIEHLIGLSRLPNVDLGVICWETAVEVFPATAFHLYDRATAVVGTHDGTAIITETERIAGYRALFDRLAASAVFDDECRTRLDRIAEDYRALR